jgi:glutamate synthase domain-containing protein 2
MSFGSLSAPAIEALNWGAAQAGFAHNTGEGSVSPYHLIHGGDLTWQIGTGYFGCRTPDGDFDPDGFAETATIDPVKMIEIKLSQGAKPGHGGILPGAKVTPEIALTRGVPVGETVVSPPVHRTFDDPIGLLGFVTQLRDLSGGKPVGFKLCVGRRREFLAIARAMVETGTTPDFITVDGGEGGTGAAPLELSDHVGMPMRDAVHFVNSALCGVGLRDRIRVLASGKTATGMDMVRTIALGADGTNAARSMMLALGCIQSRRCHDNTCPTGVATQDPGRARGLVVEEKAQRVAAYHQETIEAFLELFASMGCTDPSEIDPRHLMRRLDESTITTYDQLYPALPTGSLLEPGDAAPAEWRDAWAAARADSFA